MDFHKILDEAFQAGKKALETCVPTPVGFCQADLMGNQTGPTTIEPEGNCGGAYIRNIEYNSDIYKFFNKNAIKDGVGGNAKFTLSGGTMLRKDVYKGYTLHFVTYNFYNGQSHEKYKAFYDAACAHLRSHGVKCSVRDYLT